MELPVGMFLLGFQPLVGGSSLIGKHLVAACPFVSQDLVASGPLGLHTNASSPLSEQGYADRDEGNRNSANRGEPVCDAGLDDDGKGRGDHAGNVSAWGGAWQVFGY